MHLCQDETAAKCPARSEIVDPAQGHSVGRGGRRGRSVTDLVLGVDDKLAGSVAQGAGLLVEGFTQPLQSQNAQRVLGHSHKPFWALLRRKSCMSGSTCFHTVTRCTDC